MHTLNRHDREEDGGHQPAGMNRALDWIFFHGIPCVSFLGRHYRFSCSVPCCRCYFAFSWGFLTSELMPRPLHDRSSSARKTTRWPWPSWNQTWFEIGYCLKRSIRSGSQYSERPLIPKGSGHSSRGGPEKPTSNCIDIATLHGEARRTRWPLAGRCGVSGVSLDCQRRLAAASLSIQVLAAFRYEAPQCRTTSLRFLCDLSGAES